MEAFPEQPDEQIDLDLAPIRSRIGARAIDVLIGFMTFLVLLVIVIVAYDVELPDDASEIDIPDAGRLILQWVPILLWGLYEVPLTMTRGQTLGKIVTKIKVISVTGDAPPLRNAALLRWGVLAVPPFLIPDIGLFVTLAVGLWFLFDSKRQGLHDKAGNTYVVRVAPPGD